MRFFACLLVAATACASAERPAIELLFDRSRNMAFLKEAEQVAVIKHDNHPAFVMLVDSPTSPPPFDKPLVGREAFLKAYVPAFNERLRPFIKDAKVVITDVTVRGNAAFVTAETRVVVARPGETAREVTQRGHYFLVKVMGRGKPRWVFLADVPEETQTAVRQ